MCIRDSNRINATVIVGRTNNGGSTRTRERLLNEFCHTATKVLYLIYHYRGSTRTGERLMYVIGHTDTKVFFLIYHYRGSTRTGERLLNEFCHTATEVL